MEERREGEDEREEDGVEAGGRRRAQTSSIFSLPTPAFHLPPRGSDSALRNFTSRTWAAPCLPPLIPWEWGSRRRSMHNCSGLSKLIFLQGALKVPLCRYYCAYNMPPSRIIMSPFCKCPGSALVWRCFNYQISTISWSICSISH